MFEIDQHQDNRGLSAGVAPRGATDAFDNPDMPRFTIAGPDVRMTSGAVIAIAMTLNELCTNTTKFGVLSVPPAASTSPGRSIPEASACV